MLKTQQINQVVSDDWDIVNEQLRQKILLSFEIERGIKLPDYLVVQILPYEWLRYVRNN